MAGNSDKRFCGQENITLALEEMYSHGISGEKSVCSPKFQLKKERIATTATPKIIIYIKYNKKYPRNKSSPPQDRQADGQTDRQTDGQTDRQKD